MTEETVTDAVLRRFLLGDVEDDERQRIESLFLSDSGFRERILIAEDDLIEDYLENSLTGSDKTRFLVQYRSSPQQRRKLRLARTIKEYAVTEDARKSIVQLLPLPLPKRRSFLSAFRGRKFLVFIPVAAVMSIAVVFGVIWLVERNSRTAQENARRQEIERELAELNKPSNLSEAPREISSMVLPPVSLRSIAPQTEPTPVINGRIVELRLLWPQKEEYPSYRAVIRRVGGTEQFTIPDLHIETKPDSKVVRLRVPVHLLSRGLYQIRVSADAKPERDEEYSFTVGG